MSILNWKEEKEKINSFPYFSKIHSTLRDKKFIPVYAEDIHFLVTRAGWLVTHIYEHYIQHESLAFEQSKFKKDFVVMNQKGR